MQSQINLQDSLIGYFKLNANTLDSSPLAIHGTNNGATLTTGEDGSPNSAFSFGGDDYIDFTSDNRGLDDVISISYWFKTTMNGQGFMVNKYDYNTYGVHTGLNSGTLRFGGRNTLGGINVYTNLGPMSTVVNDGVWHQVVFILNQNEWKVYIDCNLEQQLTTSFSNLSIVNSSSLSLGRNTEVGNYNYFTGDLDEVRVYNRELTVDEINYLCDEAQFSKVLEENGISNLIVYPNPSRGIFNISYQSDKDDIEHIKIYDQTGKIVLDTKSVDKVDLTGLDSGLYLFNFYNYMDENISSKRILKQ